MEELHFKNSEFLLSIKLFISEKHRIQLSCNESEHIQSSLKAILNQSSVNSFLLSFTECFYLKSVKVVQLTNTLVSVST